MSQFYWGTIAPGSTSGDDLADLMNQTGDAMLSGNSGIARPSYAVDGTRWIDNSAPATPIINVVWSGADVPVGRVVGGVFWTSAPAESMTYDNSVSGLAAINVKAALDELAARVAILETP